MFGDIESFHTHPDKVLEFVHTHLEVHGQNNLLESNSNENILDYPHIVGAIPSTNDLIHHLQIQARNKDSRSYRSSIISHYGVTSYELTPKGRTAEGISYDGLNWKGKIDFNNPIKQIRELLDYRVQNDVYDSLDWINHRIKTPAYKIEFAEY